MAGLIVGHSISGGIPLSSVASALKSSGKQWPEINSRSVCRALQQAYIAADFDCLEPSPFPLSGIEQET